MNNQTSAKSFATGADNLRIQVLLEKLKNKLKNFAVLDRLGYKVGQVKDVKLDNARQLNLLVFSDDTYQDSRYFLVRSSQIQQIDTPNRSLTLHLSKAAIQHIPEYVMPDANMDANSLPNPNSESVPTVMEGTYIAKEHETDLGDISVESPGAENTEETLIEEVVRLLEEKLVVNVTTRKVGEVIVRKEVETRIVEVPVRREKLIVEQISPERKQLTEIDLGGEEISGIDFKEISGSLGNSDAGTTVSGEFTSLKTASLLLDAIAAHKQHGCKKVRLEIVVEDEALQKTYQEWFDRCGRSK